MKILMKNSSHSVFLSLYKILVLIAFFVSIVPSCRDEYIYDDKEPEWLGNSIYDYLKSDGNYTTIVKIIDDLGYEEILAKTGSKTLFVANDNAYSEFFKSNAWGVSRYEDLTTAQKKILLKYAMLNNAYTLNKLSNYNSGGTLIEGLAMRQETELAVIDTVSYDSNDKVPTSVYWDYHRTNGIYEVKNNTKKPIVYFTNNFIQKYGITDADFSLLTNGKTRVSTDFYVFDKKVVEANIRCKNGYIDVLESVLIPPMNMAEYISKNSNTSIFSKLLDRFCVPIYNEKVTNDYKEVHPEFSDSIFTRVYAASLSNYYIYSYNGVIWNNYLTLDPAWNSYNTGALETSMGAMFVPSNEAMNNYFSSGVGAIFKERYASWDNVPDEIVLPFIKRHMRTSLTESLPSKFNVMVDAENYALPVTESQIENTYTAVNGEVYVTNDVYPPVDYISVYSPVLLSENSKIMNWAINISETSVDGTLFAFYKLYLNSLTSNYSLFVPTDNYFTKYIDPIAYGQTTQGVLKFWYDEKDKQVYATVYKYDKTTDAVGDSVDLIKNYSFIKNRLWDLLDSHIVIDDVESGDDYYVTKGNDIIKVAGSGSSLVVQGGGDIANNTQCNTIDYYKQYNGSTFFIDKQIQPSLRSVYDILGSTPEFSDFYDLLIGVPDDYTAQIFTQQGIDYRVKFFNAFRYTVYVPTNEVIEAAISNGTLQTWSEIDAIHDDTERTAAIQKMVRFLKYHFQDNAVFFGQSINQQYQSATIKNDNSETHFQTAKNKYYKLGLLGTSNSLTITMDSKVGEPLRTAQVDKSNGLYNIIAKDYIFGKLPSNYKNVDGTGTTSGTAFSSSTITTSASAVIHQINNILTFE